MFAINLLKGRTASAPVRKLLFWGLALYIVLCSVALAWLANSSTRRLLRAYRLRRQIDAVEQDFHAQHGERRDLLEFAQDARRRLERDAKRLETIDKLIRDRVSLVTIVTGLSAPLPEGVSLLGLELDGKKRELIFSVVATEGRLERQVGGGRLASIWNEDPVLKTHFDYVRAVATRRDRVGSESAVIMQFSAKLK